MNPPSRRAISREPNPERRASLLPIGWAIAAIRDARVATERKGADRRYEFAGWLLPAALLVLFFGIGISPLVGCMLGPRMLDRVAKHTGQKPNDL